MDKKPIVEEYLEYHRNLVNKKYGDKCVVLLQNGMFYEVYNYRCVDGPDIHTLADLLNIQIGRKNKEIEEISKNNYELMGFPMHSQQKFIPILLQNGYTIAIYKQEENGKKNVSRYLDQIISPSTTLDYCIQHDNNYLMSIYFEPHQNQKDDFYICAYSFIDLSIGTSYLIETSSRVGDFHYGLDKLYQTIKLYNPREIIINVKNNWIYNREKIINHLELDIDGRVYHYIENQIDDNYFKISYQNSFLGSIFKNTGILTPIQYLDLEQYPNAIISYLLLLEFAKGHRIDIVQKLSKHIIMENTDNLILTQNSIYQLNIVSDKNSIAKNMSLLSILNNCSTAFGKRIFKDKLLNPIIDKRQLTENYEKIDKLLVDNRYIKLEERLNKILDLQRLNRRLALKVLSPNEFSNLHSSSMHMCDIFSFIEHTFPEWINHTQQHYINKYREFMDVYSRKININKLYKYNLSSIERSIFIEGVFPEIDKLDLEIEKYNIAFKNLAKELSSYIETSNLSKITNDEEPIMINICQNDRDGFYLEMTKKRCDSMRERLNGKTIDITIKVGAHPETMINEVISINTNELTFNPTSSGSSKIKIYGKIIKKWSDKIEELTKKMTYFAKETYESILEELDIDYHDILKNCVNWIANIDILKTHAKNSILYNLKKPEIDFDSNNSYFQAEGLRHPIVECVQSKVPFIPNDIKLGKDNNNFVICYGYNAVGKTTMQKSICIAIIMAQMGGFVACKSLLFSPYRYIFTRISNVDNLLKSQSSFMVEMLELKYILKHADNTSLVCIDELVASTERHSGISLVCSTILELHKRNTSVFMATHLHEISKMDEITKLSNLKICHLEVHYDELNKTLIYDRKLKDGSGTGLYGLEVAKYLDLNTEFMDQAFRIRNKLLGNDIHVFSAKKSNYNSNVFLEKCEICSYKPIHETDIPLETHHINFQCNADINGNFNDKGFHKDIEHNLVSLCKQCHQKVHNGLFELKGYQFTSNGLKLQIEEKNDVKCPVMHNKKVDKKRLSSEQLSIIKNRLEQLPLQKNMTKSMIIKDIQNEFQIKLDYAILQKIENNIYKI
jgi:DNA mismatch repair protein MutS